MEPHSYKPKLLILEDNPLTATKIQKLADDIGYDCTVAARPEQADSAIKESRFDVFSIDLSMTTKQQEKNIENMGGYLWLTGQRFSRDQTVIIYSSFYNILSIEIPLGLGTPIHGIQKGSSHKLLREELQLHADRLRRAHDGGFIWKAPESKELLKVTHMVAPTEMPVLIIGPSGSGKEGTAREIHRMSPHSRMEIVNCGGLTPTLVMSHLFGHMKDAFTGADQNRLGFLMKCSGYSAGVLALDERALRRDPTIKLDRSSGEECWARVDEENPGGTLILDEVAELPLNAQAALLRVLDGAPVKPIGRDEGLDFKVDVRIIAITNDEKKLRNGDKFRRDLLHRISAWVLRTTPFSERPGDARKLIVKAIREMVVDIGGGAEYPWQRRSDDEILPEKAWDFLKVRLDAVHGGSRGLIWLAQRAATWAWAQTLARDEKPKPSSGALGRAGIDGPAIEAAHIEQALQHQLEFNEPVLREKIAINVHGGVVAMAKDFTAALHRCSTDSHDDKQSYKKWRECSKEVFSAETVTAYEKLPHDAEQWRYGLMRALLLYKGTLFHDTKESVFLGKVGRWNSVYRDLMGSKFKSFKEFAQDGKAVRVYEEITDALVVLALGSRTSGIDAAVKEMADGVFPHASDWIAENMSHVLEKSLKRQKKANITLSLIEAIAAHAEISEAQKLKAAEEIKKTAAEQLERRATSKKTEKVTVITEYIEKHGSPTVKALLERHG